MSYRATESTYDSIYLDCGNNSLPIGMTELQDYLDSIGANYSKIDCLSVRVTGPQEAVKELHQANSSLSFPFYDQSY